MLLLINDYCCFAIFAISLQFAIFDLASKTAGFSKMLMILGEDMLLLLLLSVTVMVVIIVVVLLVVVVTYGG